ncbi:hypothetical protein Tco_1009967, partial [Tanacetum coccineum]
NMGVCSTRLSGYIEYIAPSSAA